MKTINIFSLKSALMRVPCLITLIFCSTFIYSQSALNILDLYHESFPDEKAYLVTSVSHIGDYTFHTNIGGISFESIALPSDNLKDKDIFLDYTDNRFVVRIGTQTVYPDLPFWQLSPIVQFTNSPYTVAYTQFGDTIGNRGAQCRFHPAFLDNLLGLRLFQADLLNLTDILWDLPIDLRRLHILAPSEKINTPVRDSILHRAIYEKLSKDKIFTSFVLTDKDVKFVFETDGTELKISGTPYYYFTKTTMNIENIQKIRNELIDCYKNIDNHARILLKGDYSPEINPRVNLDSLVAVLVKYKQQEHNFNPYSVQYLEDAIIKLDSLNRLTDEEIGIQFHALDDYSESFKSYWDTLKKYNSRVYSAVENTAQWSAFFRYVREVNPNNWAQFIEKVNENKKTDAPEVITPTSYDINYFRYFEEKEKGEK